MGEKKNVLVSWVEACGGADKAGKLLGVTGRAVRVWLRGTSYPQARTLMKIEQLSKLSAVKILASIQALAKK